MVTQQRLKELMRYSPDTGDFSRLVSVNNKTKAGEVPGWHEQATRRNAYRRIEIDGKSYRAHQLAFLYMTGEMPQFVDHIDGNGLNNAWANLRAVTHDENMKNQALRSNNSSGLMGVHFVTSRDKWQARINVNGERKSLGYFTDFFEACCARKSAENEADYHENHGRAA